METASDSANCLCAAVCAVLTGWNDQASVLEEFLVKHRREGPNSHLYSLPLSDKHWESPEELEYACAADLTVFARALRVNILVYWPAKDSLPARWVQFPGHHHGSGGDTMYFAHLVSNQQGHIVPVVGVQSC